jgi:outer membrane protein assembly factor BamB
MIARRWLLTKLFLSTGLRYAVLDIVGKRLELKRFREPNVKQQIPLLNLAIRITVGVLLAATTSSADWMAFRGPSSDGVARGDAPISCDENSIAWSVATPGKSVSSPIVVGDQVIVTASSGVHQDRLHVISFDVASGKKQWHRQFWATGRTLCHPTSANAAPTPTSDGQRVVAFFSSNDVVCLSLAGELQWFRGLGNDHPRAGNDVGMASSPLLANGVVVCQIENQGDSFVAALDAETGKSLWRQDRPRSANWTSPVFLPGADDLLLLKCSGGVSAHHLRTGAEAWSIEAKAGGIPCMVVTDKHIYVPGQRFLVLDHTGDLPTVVWESQKISPDPSPIVHEGRMYFINSVGVLTCVDVESGDQLWQVRIRGKYWASPVLAGSHIYAVNDAGQLTIVNKDGQKVSQYQFDGNVLGSPAIADGALYIRGESKLWKVANR